MTELQAQEIIDLLWWIRLLVSIGVGFMFGTLLGKALASR